MGVRKEVQLSVRGGGARVPRLGGSGNPPVRGYFGCGDSGHVQCFCPREGTVALRSGRTGRCWGCGGVGHYITECPGQSPPVSEADGSFSQGQFGGGLKCGGGDLADAPAGKGGIIRGGSALGYVNRFRAPVGGAPQGAR